MEAWQQGEYICTAVVDTFEHAKLSHHLFIRGRRFVVRSISSEVKENALVSNMQIVASRWNMQLSTLSPYTHIIRI